MQIRNIICFLLLLTIFESSGQETKSNQISFAYYGNAINEQGARIGAHFYKRRWTKEKKNESIIHRDLFIQPNLGFYSRPLFYSSVQIAGDIGIRQQKEGSKWYQTLALGAGYLARFEVISFTVDFKGEVDSKDYELWEFFIPMLSYEIGRDITDEIGWYFKFNYGLRLPFQESQDQSGVPLVELGMKLPLSFKKKANE